MRAAIVPAAIASIIPDRTTRSVMAATMLAARGPAIAVAIMSTCVPAIGMVGIVDAYDDHGLKEG
jgi:hypothetical protein